MSTVEPALYATQGGGLAVLEGDAYVWHSDIPKWLDAQEGDPIPEEWGVVGINDAAHRETELAIDPPKDDFIFWD